MPSRVPLPPEWACLEGKVDFVQRVSATELSASCPQCGSEGHNGRDWPDRLRIFGSERVWCRRCGYFAFRDQLDGGGGNHSPEEIERFRQERIAEQEQRKRSAERALEHLRNDALWLKYHQLTDSAGKKHWCLRGIPEEWQQHWLLGYVDYDLFWNGTTYYSPAESIPIFDHQWAALNIKMRLDRPPDGAGRYRYVYPNLPQHLYLTEPGRMGEVVVAEGEVKAMNVHLVSGVHTVGLPGKQPGEDIVAQLREYDKITLLADPDAKRAMVKLANKVGVKKCHFLLCPEKIDDAIIKYKWQKKDVLRVLKGALRMADYV